MLGRMGHTKLTRGGWAVALFVFACSDGADVEPSEGGGGSSTGGNSTGGAVGSGGGWATGGAAGSAGASPGATAGLGPGGAAGSAGSASGGTTSGGGGGSSSGATGGVSSGGGGAPPAKDPCAGDPNGKHCGGPIGGEPSHLYTCAGGVTISDKTCANGCFKADAEDTCAVKCCIGKPPGYTVANGVWNSCPFKPGVSSREHMAIDYAGAKNDPIPASMDGTIWYIRNPGDPNCIKNNDCTEACKATGNTIVLKAACGDPLKPANDLFLRYHHINGVAAGIKVGSKVARGTTIAKVGDSGCAFGAHIHFQVATHPKGKYAQGTLPNFYDCATTKDPTTRLCTTLNP